MLSNCALKLIFRRLNYANKQSAKLIRSISTNPPDNRFKVHIIPALKDNYMYLLIDTVQKNAIAVDPVEPEKILECTDKENVPLKAVLTTHHHLDHAGGNSILSEKIKNIPIFGGDDRIDSLTTKLSHNEVFSIENTVIRCLHTPCHTLGHVCYFVQSSEPICFTGDTLFVAGCGRFFEGSAEHMFKSLNILSQLPLNTKIYCGHEYTVSNLKFALFVEPDNIAASEKLKIVDECLRQKRPTVPSTIKDELSFNPFLRAHEESIKKFTKQNDPVAVIKTLRDLKDKFVC